MKTLAIFATSILALFLATAVVADAQHGHAGREQKGRGRHQVHAHQQEYSRPFPVEHARHGGPHEAVQRGAEPRMQYRQPAPGHFREASRREPQSFARQNIWERQRAQHWQHEHRHWNERGGYHGYVIPEERFRAHFGRGHCFRIHEVPVVVVERYPRFQFGGFWFSLVDPWPESWSPTWYRTDEVYVDYVNDGYYLYNRQHPGVSIAINVSL